MFTDSVEQTAEENGNSPLMVLSAAGADARSTDQIAYRSGRLHSSIDMAQFSEREILDDLVCRASKTRLAVDALLNQEESTNGKDRFESHPHSTTRGSLISFNLETMSCSDDEQLFLLDRQPCQCGTENIPNQASLLGRLGIQRKRLTTAVCFHVTGESR